MNLAAGLQESKRESRVEELKKTIKSKVVQEQSY